ncbi:hypothetical protein [Streptomyces triculaminicus]|uniref:hypothetical protein n=1 Tax=Streptomyces triculaminicus TaxID=2816232 RepID=UPI0037A3E6AF
MRRTLLAAIVGTLSLITAGAATGVAAAAPGPADDSLPSAVETFDYPNATKIFKERGIALRKGDGHILLADCAATTDIVVLSSKLDLPAQDNRFCFRVTGTGKSGYLSLEIPKVYYIATGDYAVRASLTADGKTTDVNVARHDGESVGQGTNPPGSPTVLVELRVTG